ncbi:MAG: glycosyltransferase family 39 protein [Planctomycetota bacterium]|nr:glycosyltransferase family 39 protein [Planctomycetota bacterium]
MRQQLFHQFLIAAVTILVYFTNLGAAGLWDEDEPIYASCAREMLEADDWVVPMFNGRLFPDKPPLMFWGMLCGFQLFGCNELVARFPSALLGLATGLATYHLGRRLFSPSVGLWAGLILASTLIFTISARAATVDCALAFLTVVTMLAFTLGGIARHRRQGKGTPDTVSPSRALIRRLRTVTRSVSEEERRFLADASGYEEPLLACCAPIRSSPLSSQCDFLPNSWFAFAILWAAMGVSVLGKGPIALLLPAASIGLFLMIMNHHQRTQVVPPSGSSRRWVRALVWFAQLFSPANFCRSLWQMRPLTGILIVTVVALPWYVLVGMRTHGVWLQEFFGRFNVRPFMQPILGHSGPFWYYVPAILIGFFPWSVFLGPVLADCARRIRQSHSWGPGYLLLVCWSIVPIVFWSICSSKLPHYMVPIFPALALATAAFIDHWLAEPAIFSRRLIWTAWGITIFVGLGFLAVFPVLAAYFLPGEERLGWLGLILVVGGSVSLVLVLQGRRRPAMITFATMSVLVITAIFGYATWRIDRHQNARPLLAAIRQDCPVEPRLVGYCFLQYSYIFYAGHPIPEFGDAQQLH